MTEHDEAAKISKILSAWGPVGDSQAATIDLGDYDVEAEDILWAMKLYGYSVKRAITEVFREAFQIELDPEELDHYGGEIETVLQKQ